MHHRRQPSPRYLQQLMIRRALAVQLGSFSAAACRAAGATPTRPPAAAAAHIVLPVPAAPAGGPSGRPSAETCAAPLSTSRTPSPPEKCAQVSWGIQAPQKQTDRWTYGRQALGSWASRNPKDRQTDGWTAGRQALGSWASRNPGVPLSPEMKQRLSTG
jgi:hypothetical protein